MNEEISYNELHNIGSICQVCKRHLDGRRDVKACSLCLIKVQGELEDIHKEAEKQRLNENRQYSEWKFKFLKKLTTKNNE